MPKWWMVPFTRWRTANPCKLRTIYLQRLLYTVVWIFFFFCNFIPLHLLWSFLKNKKQKTLLPCIITHTQRRQYSKQVSVLFGKSWFKGKNQRTDNFLLFSFFKMPEWPASRQTNLLILTIDVLLQCKHKNYLRPFFDGTPGNSTTEALGFKRLQLYTFCLRNEDLNIKRNGNLSSRDQCMHLA